MFSNDIVNLEQISPLCVRIKNAFNRHEIDLINSTYLCGIEPIISINPNSKLKVAFDQKYVEGEVLGSFTIYNDKKDEKDKEDVVQMKIFESEYTKKNGLANIVCFIPLSRIDQNDLKRNHSKILCKTVYNIEFVGNTVTYLDSIFSRFAQNVYIKMIDYCKFVDVKMKWNLLKDDSYRTKCIKYIQYEGKGANVAWHCDLGSLLTIVIMLSDCKEYEGANLQVKKLEKINNEYVEKEAQNVQLESGDIALWYGDKCNHRVTNLINGTRTVLIMELIFW